jgi:serine O-acetyltransferase
MSLRGLDGGAESAPARVVLRLSRPFSRPFARLARELLRLGTVKAVMSSQTSESMQLLVLPARAPLRRVAPSAISAERADWSREEPRGLWDPSRRLLASIRAHARAAERGGIVGLIGRRLAVLRHRFWSVVSGADIPINTSRLGGGLLLPHPQGVVIHPDVELGPNCLLLQQVTLGTGPRPGTPRLGGHVDVGAGAKVLGGVTIGDHAVIGANAVVISDVPPHAVAVGVPAVVKKRRGAPPVPGRDEGPLAPPSELGSA